MNRFTSFAFHSIFIFIPLDSENGFDFLLCHRSAFDSFKSFGFLFLFLFCWFILKVRFVIFVLFFFILCFPNFIDAITSISRRFEHIKSQIRFQSVVLVSIEESMLRMCISAMCIRLFCLLYSFWINAQRNSGVCIYYLVESKRKREFCPIEKKKVEISSLSPLNNSWENSIP